MARAGRREADMRGRRLAAAPDFLQCIAQLLDGFLVAGLAGERFERRFDRLIVGENGWQLDREAVQDRQKGLVRRSTHVLCGGRKASESVQQRRGGKLCQPARYRRSHRCLPRARPCVLRLNRSITGRRRLGKARRPQCRAVPPETSRQARGMLCLRGRCSRKVECTWIETRDGSGCTIVNGYARAAA